MEELRDMPSISSELLSLVPQTLDDAESLVAAIEKAVQEQTSGGIANLAVIVGPDAIFLHGSCSSYYQKQLAQHAAMTVPTGLGLTNCIEVD
jgi:hypothetical protein